jgi:hypothetical protein
MTLWTEEQRETAVIAGAAVAMHALILTNRNTTMVLPLSTEQLAQAAFQYAEGFIAEAERRFKKDAP